ncbi:UDP-N-acetylglucosamine 4,6-dehydratase (inverting) [Microscilla marina]|uniref:Polysaccharide biosynthesis protein n=1 Tax=Microscilla marina ATCC 23134 TaxID=313606 RepID=A1ZCJ2_MICM2|nr:UDP-N-acetylglucosamine 4,6-dehydratase (inverting) [Microscilla marina]EAY31994.1 polysaccharide biosynthesis protein [Microscilla marina ATCC 23134]
MLDLNSKSILITGGTGSFGKKCTETLLQKFPSIKKIVIYSRDELKQFEMNHHTPYGKHKALRYFIGDVRDGERLKRACEGIDFIIHAAALKHVPVAEYNPMECIKTNIFGAENIINAALDCGVQKVIALSTDKAAAPINLYGATKLCSDKLFVAANNMRGDRSLTFSVVRYGNVMGSRGSVIPFFLQKRKEGVLPITDPEMTRFNILLEDGVDLVFYALENAIGGEVFIPKIPSYKITELAKAIAPNCEQKIVGIRPGEKLHEEMLTTTDSLNTIETQKYYVIVPSPPFKTHEETMNKYITHYHAQEVDRGFSYNSGKNSEWLNVEELRTLIKNYIAPGFTI